MKYVSEYYGICNLGDSITHHGIKGQKWGIRRFQNPDGTLTEAGKKRYDKYHTKEGWLNYEGTKKYLKTSGKASKEASSGKYKKAAKLYVKAANSVGEDAQREYRKFLYKEMEARNTQILSQEAANDPKEPHWNRKEFQSYADENKRNADTYKRIANEILKANKNVKVDEITYADDNKYASEKLAALKGKRYDKKDPDISKTRPGTDKRLRAINPGDLQAQIEKTSGSLYDGVARSARYKKVMEKYKKHGGYQSDYVDDLAKAALLDLGYKPSKKNIEYIRKLRVIDWD